MTAPVVSDPAKISADWLTGALRDAGVAGGGVVRSFDSQVVGTGQMGRNVRFTLDWDGRAEGAPDRVVGKFPSDDPKSRATGQVQGAYRKEVCFYRDLAPTVDIRTPHCFYAGIEENGADFCLLLEDLAPAVQGDQIAGCTPDQAALALEELARLHAPRWADPALESLDFLDGGGPERAQFLQVFYGTLIPGFRERYASRLDAASMEVAERLGPKLASWATGSDAPRTVAHGDYRLDNMLFGTSEGGAPLAVVDWQTVALGPALSDAAYFLGASLLPNDRREHEEALLRGYHAALVGQGISGYGWDRCWQDYRRFTFSGVVMAVVASMIVEQTERGDEMFLAMASRHAAHVLELDAESLL